MLQHFMFKGNKYLNGTIVKIYDNKQSKFKFSHYLKFIGVENNKYYRFCSLYNNLECYNILERDLEKYIEKIDKPVTLDMIEIKPKVESKNINGIIPAWTWYILAMAGSIFVSGIVSKLLLIIVPSCIFWSWKAKKMRGE